MSAWSSGGIGGRLGRDLWRQNNRNPARCRRGSVRGPTTTSASRQSNQRESTTKDTRSAALGRLCFTSRSWYIANCFRRKKFSEANARQDRSRSRANTVRSTSSRTKTLARHMAPVITPPCVVQVPYPGLHILELRRNPIIAEASRQHTRRHERRMRRFRSRGQAQRFLSVEVQAHNLFRVGRYLMRATYYRLLHTRSFATWNLVTSV
jgi:hypothetical protein